MSCTECTPSFKVCRHSTSGTKPERLFVSLHVQDCGSFCSCVIPLSLSAFFEKLSCAVLRSSFQSCNIRFAHRLSCAKLLAKQLLREIDAMKRSAAEAGFPVEGQIILVTVCVPADRCTRNEPMTIPLVCRNSDNVDAVKKILDYRIREITGRCPHIPCFQFRMADIFRSQNRLQL